MLVQRGLKGHQSEPITPPSLPGPQKKKEKEEDESTEKERKEEREKKGKIKSDKY